METLFEVAAILVGLLLFIIGLSAHIVALIIIGLILLALGGVWVVCFDDDFDWDFF